MENTSLKAQRLRDARAKAGYGSATEAASAFGWGESGYRHHENGTRGFGADAAKKYGRAFKVKAGWLMAMDGFDDQAPPAPSAVDGSNLVVNGSVEAGAWREGRSWNDERRFSIEGMPSPLPGAKRFGLVVTGRSMDLVYEPGTVLDCVSIFKDGVAPQDGDHVIVERARSDGLRELTVKEYQVEDGRFFLMPRSTRAEFSERIEIGEPDRDHTGDDHVTVIAFVVADYPPRVLRLFERMGKILRVE